jgi:hypothetical protein
MLKKPFGMLLVGAAVSLFALAGCQLLSQLTGGANGAFGAGGPTGSVKLLVTDKPYPVALIDAALVTITRVEVRPAGEDDDSFIVIYEGEKTMDLLDLRNGRTNLLADAEIPAGSYDQMRLIVTEGTVRLVDGREFNLKVPSGPQTGIKLHTTFEVQADAETVLILDVDLSRAFRAIPSGHISDVAAITSFQFHPSLAMRLIVQLEAGQITGMIVDDAEAPVDMALVTAFDGDTEVTSTVTDPDGTFMLMGLHTATYRVEVSASGFDDHTVSDVEVTAGQTTELGVIALTPIAP